MATKASKLIQLEKNFQVFVGIDFGTDGTGLAYGLPSGEVFVHQKWKGYKRSVEVKPKTRILLDSNGNFLAFGQPATNSYITMGGEKTGWMLFERFKMALYGKDLKKTDTDISDNLIAANGKEFPSSQVFVEALKYIKSQVFKFFIKNKLNIENVDDIQWILTVPAIWTEKAKYKMEQWAISAGLVNKLIPNHLKIVYEPDCASLSIQYEIEKLNQKKQHQPQNDPNSFEKKDCKIEKVCVEEKYQNSSNWIKGCRYILIDAGGGTCDVACHEILGDFAVKEVVHPTGGPWGSTYIDDYFILLLNRIFTKKWIDQFKKEDPAAYTELVDNFRVAKQEFWSDVDSECGNKIDEKWHNVQLPFDLCTFLEEKVEDCDLETLVEETEFNNKNGLVLLEDEYLRINYTIWCHELFDLVCNPIINHCKYLLTEKLDINNTSYICLVGGLGASKYLQYKIKSIFGHLSSYKLNIIIPSRPILSVVDGAARFGLQPDYIQARTLSKTYGNAIDPKIDVIDIDALPPGYLEINQYRCDHSNVLRVRNIFSIYARKNQTVHIHDKPIIRKYKRFNAKQKKVRISVYSSNEENPRVVKQKPCAKTTVVFPANSTELSIIVELYFNDTKIRVFAYPEDDPDNKKEMELDYEYQ